jgi:hypothetical protein
VAPLGRVLLQLCLISLDQDFIVLGGLQQGHPPPHTNTSMRAYTDEVRLPAVHQQIVERDDLLIEVCEHLEQAHQYYKMFYDR